jgi:heat shock transcription factor
MCSFLDSSNNTELIRWSDDGNSFIVLDEDEFARTLIPELFKHNNYASFVRQLNMYGFHKKVGLNANSMKAAEKKVKDPSVYWHEYFKRGRPDLLWLIQKPAAKSSGSKRKRDQEKREPGDSDDEQKHSPEAGDGAAALMTTMPRQDMGTFRTELQNLKRQQSVISKMITSLKDQNEQFYRQATAFQALHDRHENSINAILTFLATFYNRSLDGHSGPPNLASFLSSASIPQQAQQQGSVFDMGDGDMNDGNANNTNNQQLQRYQKRPLLLPAPGAQTLSASPFSNASPSVRSSTSPGPAQQYGPRPPQPRPHQPQQPQRASVTPVIKDDAPTPDFVNQYPENDDVMNLIHNVNASNSPNNGGAAANFDINSALDHLQAVNSNSTLTPQERDEMLSMIAASGATGAGATAAQPGANNALMMPNPPTMPSLEALRQNTAQLEMLAKMQQEQDSKVADLAGRLQPLSPTGAIPGINANNFEELGNPGDFDLGTFLNETDDGYFGTFDGTSAPQQSTYPATASQTQGINDDLGFDWGYAQTNGLQDTDDLFGDGGAPGTNDGSLGIDERGGRVVGSVSSAGTSPPDVTKAGDDEETPSKKRKTG